jgi:hypothetical protein
MKDYKLRDLHASHTLLQLFIEVYYESIKREPKIQLLFISSSFFFQQLFIVVILFCLPLLWPNEFPSDRGGIHSVG